MIQTLKVEYFLKTSLCNAQVFAPAKICATNHLFLYRLLSSQRKFDCDSVTMSKKSANGKFQAICAPMTKKSS